MEWGRTQGLHEERALPGDLASLREGAVLYDRHCKECYQVTGIDETGIGLHRDGADFYVPCSWFVNWYGRRLFSIEEIRSAEVPEWCTSTEESMTSESGPVDPISDVIE